jgi:hypothetical protein
MKQFFKFIALSTVFILVTLVTLDVLYTKIYENNVVSNKVKYLISLNNTHVDALFLGSSRVDNHIVSSEFRKKGLNIINAGIQGVSLKDNFLFLKILKKNKVTFERLFVQVDYVYNQSDLSQTSYTELLPYFRKPVISAFFKEEYIDYNKYYYLPFYRYAVNDYRIGFRGLVSNLFSEKRINGVFNDYSPLYGSSIMKPYSLPNKLTNNPEAFNKIKDFCERNDIEVVYFTAPFCSKLKTSAFTELLAEKINNYKDYSTLLKNDLLFKSCGHLNNEGAIFFTNKIIDDYFKYN